MDIFDVMLWRQELVEVADGGVELIGEQGLSLSPLPLLDKVEADDWRAKPPQAAHEVKGSRRFEWSGSINCTKVCLERRKRERERGRGKIKQATST